MGSIWWYLARSSGIIAWLTSSASMTFGLALAGRYRGGMTPAWVLAMHRWCSALTVALVTVHLGALLADDFVEFSIGDLLVPGLAGYQRGPLALGVVSLWLLLAVELSSLLRRHVPRQVWHGIHLASYVAWCAATWHGLSVGTDASKPWYVMACALVAGGLLGLASWRVYERRGVRAGRVGVSCPP